MKLWGFDRGRIKRRRKQALKNRAGSFPVMQAVVSATRCIWCDAKLNVEDWMEMAYQTCGRCLYPLPTD